MGIFSCAILADAMVLQVRAIVMAAALAVGLAASLAGCKIVKIGDKAAIDPSDPNNFNAKTYVTSIWASKAVPFYQDHAHPILDVLAAIAKDKDAAGQALGHRATAGGTPWTFAVKGEGTIKSMTSGTRHGEMTVELGPADHPTEAVLQVGPVVFGTALRDALPFIAFGDFVNQIQYAEVSRAINDRAVAAMAKALEPAPKPGEKVSFIGGMIDPAEAGGLVVTPMELKVEAGS